MVVKTGLLPVGKNGTHKGRCRAKAEPRVVPPADWPSARNDAPEPAERDVDTPATVTAVTAAPRQNGNQAHKSPNADAPLRKAGRCVIGSLHATVLFGIVGLLGWYLILLPATVGDRRLAVVAIVAESLIELRTPTEGEFEAVGHMPNGTPVRKGQLLGEVRSTQLEAKIQAAERMLAALKQRKLLLEQRGSEFEDLSSRPEAHREFRECFERIVATESELDRLRRIRRGLRIISPVNGRVQTGFSGSRAVETNDTVAYVWPEQGELLVEVKAPLKVIHRLIQADKVESRFPTVGGETRVTSRPIAGSLRVTTLERGIGKKKELWGFLQCRPVSVPQDVAYPGPIGKL